MRREEREITDKADILSILDQMQVLRIAFGGYPVPYIVPLSFGYEWQDELVFYVHGAKQGRKARIVMADGHKGVPVAFELDRLVQYRGEGQEGCHYTALYESVMGEGTVRVLSEEADQKRAFDAIMAHCTGREGFTYNKAVLERTLIMSLTVSSLSAKRNG